MNKVIHRELGKKMKFDHSKNCYFPNQESVLKNETHKFQWDFDVQTDHVISARRPDFMIINQKKRICRIVNFAVTAIHTVKLKESEYIKLDEWRPSKLECNPYIRYPEKRETFPCSKLEHVLPKQNIPNPDIRDLFSGPDNYLISGLHCTTILRSARILRRVLEIWEDLLLSLHCSTYPWSLPYNAEY